MAIYPLLSSLRAVKNNAAIQKKTQIDFLPFLFLVAFVCGNPEKYPSRLHKKHMRIFPSLQETKKLRPSRHCEECEARRSNPLNNKNNSNI
jgi:hypothetical protein